MPCQGGDAQSLGAVRSSDCLVVTVSEVNGAPPEPPMRRLWKYGGSPSQGVSFVLLEAVAWAEVILSTDVKLFVPLDPTVGPEVPM